MSRQWRSQTAGNTRPQTPATPQAVAATGTGPSTGSPHRGSTPKLLARRETNRHNPSHEPRHRGIRRGDNELGREGSKSTPPTLAKLHGRDDY